MFCRFLHIETISCLASTPEPTSSNISNTFDCDCDGDGDGDGVGCNDLKTITITLPFASSDWGWGWGWGWSILNTDRCMRSELTWTSRSSTGDEVGAISISVETVMPLRIAQSLTRSIEMEMEDDDISNYEDGVLLS